MTLFDAGIDTRIPDEPRPFLTMELVGGQDLRSRIRHSPVPLDELAVIGAGSADALAYVHSLGIIHRDIKPGNILMVQTRPGEPLRAKVTDFGIARIADSTRLTATGAMVGTAAYLSPEQAMGSPLSPATDVYSLGLVLLECIKQAMEYPGSAVESAVARLHRPPEHSRGSPGGVGGPDPIDDGNRAAGPPEQPPMLRQRCGRPLSRRHPPPANFHRKPRGAARHALQGAVHHNKFPGRPASPPAQPPKIPSAQDPTTRFRHPRRPAGPHPRYTFRPAPPGTPPRRRDHPVQDTRGGSRRPQS